MEAQARCGNCKHYAGGGDFNLCCDKHGWLCYEHTEPCDLYEFSQETVQRLEEQERMIYEWIRQQKEKKGATAP